MHTQGLAIAQKLRRPLVIGASIPLYPSREYALVTVRAKPFSVGIFNLMLHWLVFKSTSPHPWQATHAWHDTRGTRHTSMALT
jgi:hypothetical protein